MELIILLVIIVAGVFAGYYTGILAAKTDKKVKEYTDPIINFVDRTVSRDERKARIKEKYGFDSSYDKYIA